LCGFFNYDNTVDKFVSLIGQKQKKSQPITKINEGVTLSYIFEELFNSKLDERAMVRS
jgi:hypothetical protein